MNENLRQTKCTNWVTNGKQTMKICSKNESIDCSRQLVVITLKIFVVVVVVDN